MVSTSQALGLCLLCAVASFVAGFFAGDRVGTKDTERRWNEAAGRAAEARDRASERLNAECRRDRIGDAENIGRLLSIIEKLKTGSCWCGLGIGNPMLSSHSENCKRAAEAVGVKL